jgi:hypothetical protein
VIFPYEIASDIWHLSLRHIINVGL